MRCWLLKDDTGVGEKAARVLGDLLETDCDVVPPVYGPRLNGVNGTEVALRQNRQPGHGRLWRLILLDRSILGIIPSSCRPGDAERTERQVSISQGRLLRILTRLSALNITALTRTPHPDLLPLPEAVADEAGCGLLQWAALGMIDRADVLMHLNWIDFFETFISVMRVSGRSPETDEAVVDLVRASIKQDPGLEAALRDLPDRTVEEESDPLRRYINEVLNSAS